MLCNSRRSSFWNYTVKVCRPYRNESFIYIREGAVGTFCYYYLYLDQTGSEAVLHLNTG